MCTLSLLSHLYLYNEMDLYIIRCTIFVKTFYYFSIIVISSPLMQQEVAHMQMITCYVRQETQMKVSTIDPLLFLLEVLLRVWE